MNQSKESKRRIQGKTLAIMMAAAMLVGTAFAPGVSSYIGTDTVVHALETDESVSDNVTYCVLTDGTVEINAYLKEDEDVILPSEINGKIVSSINIDNMSSYKIHNLVIPYGVKTIKSLGLVCGVEVSPNNDYFYVKDGALFNKETAELIRFFDTKCTEYVVPDGTKSIADDAFGSYPYDPHDIKESEAASFSVYALEKVAFPDSLKSIGEGAFSECQKLSEVENLDNVDFVEKSAFSLTPWYHNLPDGPVYLGKTFVEYKGDAPENTMIEIKDGTKKIARCALNAVENIVSVTIPDSVKIIEDSAFLYCWDLSNISIPDSVELIGESAFMGTKWYEDFYEKQPDGPIYIGKVLYGCKGDDTNSVSIKEGTKSISPFAFVFCQKLTDVKIPDGVESIGEKAFYDTGLKTVTIPSSVSYIGDFALGYTDKVIEEISSDSDVIYTDDGDVIYTDDEDVGDILFDDEDFSENEDEQYGDENIDDGTVDVPDFDFPEEILVPDFIIKGQKGTAAEVYASDNGIRFVSIDTEDEPNEESKEESKEESDKKPSDDKPTEESTEESNKQSNDKPTEESNKQSNEKPSEESDKKSDDTSSVQSNESQVSNTTSTQTFGGTSETGKSGTETVATGDSALPLIVTGALALFSGMISVIFSKGKRKKDEK